MKFSIIPFWTICTLLFAGITLGSCGETNSETYEEQNQDTLNVPDEQAETDAARRQRLSDRIREMEIELDRAITDLDTRIESATAAEKVKWQIRRDKLAMERDQLKLDLERMGTEISNDWQQMENDVADRLEKISEDLREDN